MPTLTIRNLHARSHEALKARAARSGRSMEAEARRIIDEAVGAAPDRDSFEQAVREAQAAFAPYRLPELLMSEELIADRRLEAWKETVEFNQWISEAARNRAGHAQRRP